MRFLLFSFLSFIMVNVMAQQTITQLKPRTFILNNSNDLDVTPKKFKINPGEESSRAWQVIFSDNFDGSWPGSWSLSASGPDAYWGQWSCWSNSGSNSAGCAAAGSAAISCGNDYLSSMSAWMVVGPFDLSSPLISDGKMDYYLNLNTEFQADYVYAVASTNGLNFSGSGWTGTGSGPFSLDLTNVPGLGNLIGESQVWLGFYFSSDASNELTNGAQIDDVSIEIDAAPSNKEIDLYPSKLIFDESIQYANNNGASPSPPRSINGGSVVPNFFARFYEVPILNDKQLYYYANYYNLEMTSEIHIVELDLSLLNTDDVFNLNFPGNKENLVFRTKKNIRGSNQYSWFGKFIGEFIGDAIIVRENQDVSGSFHLDNELYLIKPLGGGLQALIKVDPTSFPDDHPPEYDELELNHNHDHYMEHFRGGSRADDGSVVTLIVAYTPAAAAAVANINTTIQLAVDETNQSYTNSDIDPVVYLVHKYQTSYIETTSMAADLQRFREKDDGYMEEIHQYRDEYGADICILIMDTDQPGGVCGLASDILASETNAFCAVHYSCATGYYSFAHEIGHLQGARHNPEEDPSTSPFAYGHGFLYTTGGWRTVMSYNDEDNCPGGYCTRLQYWSNPDINYSADRVAMGTIATHDNARVLDETATTMAALRQSDTTSFLIKNTGGENLTIDSIKYSEDWLSLFGYPSTPFTIAATSSQSISVTVDWSKASSVNDTATVKVYSNDADEPVLDFDIYAFPVPLPQNLLLEDDTVKALNVVCFDASNVIILSGTGKTFVVESGGEATFIAGDSVILKEGVQFLSGSEVGVYITSTDEYCGDGVYDYSIVSVDEDLIPEHIVAIDKLIKVFPNPTTGEINIVIDGADELENITMQLFDMVGRMIEEETMSMSNQSILNLSGYENGIYFLRIFTGRKYEIIKIIKN